MKLGLISTFSRSSFGPGWGTRPFCPSVAGSFPRDLLDDFLGTIFWGDGEGEGGRQRETERERDRERRDGAGEDGVYEDALNLSMTLYATRAPFCLLFPHLVSL